MSIHGVDQAGLDFIANLEGVIPYAYNDSRGFATAWVGHLIAERPVNAADLKKWGSKQHPAKHADVLAFFKKDLAAYEKAVNAVWAHSPHPPNQHEYNSCVSLAFNIGTGGFASSTAANLIKHGAPARDIAAAFLKWNKPPEIQGRRRKEHDLYLKR